MFLNWPESEAEKHIPVESLRQSVIAADKIKHTQREREIYTSYSHKLKAASLQDIFTITIKITNAQTHK